MGPKAIAVFFVLLIASAQCQSTIGTCLNNAANLGQVIGEYIAQKDWFNVPRLTTIMGRINDVISTCGPLIQNMKQGELTASQENLQGFSLQCLAAITSAIAKIKQIKGTFSGGFDLNAVLRELASIGGDVDALKAACK